MKNVTACFIELDASIYTDDTSIHIGIINMHLEESMHFGRGSMNIARANMNIVCAIIHIGIVYILVLEQIWLVYIGMPIWKCYKTTDQYI